MRKTPLISILIPAYNHEKYVEVAICSVIKQNWTRIELLVIDDGSRDETWNILQRMHPKCEKHFERVLMERQENQGTGATLSKLVEMARGEYVMFLASDDMLMPESLSTLVRPMEEDPAVGLVVGRNEIMDGNGKKCFWNEKLENVYDEAQAFYLDFTEQIEQTTGIVGSDSRFGNYAELLKGNHIGNGQLIRRSCLLSVMPFRKEAPLEDWWLHLQLSKICRYKYVPEITFRYRWHSANTIKQRNKMERILRQTLHWEHCHIITLHNQRWKKIFDRTFYQEHRILTIGRSFGLLRRDAKDRNAEWFLRCGQREWVLRKRIRVNSGLPLKILVVVHVYYPELWDELARCIRNIEAQCDVVVTYSDEKAIVQARTDFPEARFLQCGNVGYDVLPFFKALQSTDLAHYDFVVKVHTKRAFPIIPKSTMDRYALAYELNSGDFWRRELLSFIATPKAWQRTLRTFKRPEVGMVSSPLLIAGRKVLGLQDPVFPDAVAEMRKLTPVDCQRGNFVMGTMFMMRAQILLDLELAYFSEDKFVNDGLAHKNGFAHICERILGLCVTASGMRVVGYSGSWRKWEVHGIRVALFAICRFFYRKKVKKNGSIIIKVCKIPIWEVHAK